LLDNALPNRGRISSSGDRPGSAVEDIGGSLEAPAGEAFRLFEKQFRRILEGGIGRVIGAFRQMAVKRELKPIALRKLEEHLAYFENNRHRMKYDE
jgi:hypothetical protein